MSTYWTGTNGTSVPIPYSPHLVQTNEGEHHGNTGGVPMEISRSTYIYCLCACLNSCNLGYDIGIGTQAGRLIQDDLGLTRVQRELFVGSIDFWAMFGALSAQYVSDTYGRRKTFLVAATGFIFGVVITGIAQTYSVLMLGRMLVGLGVGVGLAIDPLYIAEISPAKHRGELVTWSEIALNVGIVLGFSMSIILAPIADGTEWRWMFFAGTIMPIVMIALVLKVMPESPRWLVSKGRETEAFEILQTIYPKGYDVDLVVHDMKEAYVRDRAVEHAAGWQIIWNPTPAFRRILLVGIGVAVAQQAVGIDSIQYYLLDVLEKSGINSEQKQNLLLIFLGMVKLLFIVVGGKLFDIKGRRPLLFISLIGMAIALLMISITFFIASSTSSGFIIFGLGMYLAAFSVGMGPGAWLVPAEVFPTSIRAKAMSLSAFLNRATATLMASTFLSTANAIGWGGFFLLLSIISLLVLGFLWIYLPETKGRSLEDMSTYFAEITGDNSILEAEVRISEARDPAVELSILKKSQRTTDREVI